MVDFSYEIINQIKEAIDNNQVNAIIQKSLETLVAKKGIATSKQMYMTNMVMVLRYIKAKELNAQASSNINHAIEVFEALRKKHYSNLF